ncbi:MAG TPA: helix-turn-helix domain-containing protein [Jatrophihabitans sp.]|jgi:DNA-binding MarR family transcriptional regulator|nr:helix-turn-helix domain-containing protein [Jatrophihabitans sp.]
MITPGLSTRVRVLLEAMDADVGLALADLGLRDYRTRYSAVVRVIVADGPSSIRHIADKLGITHSGASQLVAEMERRGLLELRAGTDARQRHVRLTAKSRRLRPAIDAEWEATDAASAALDAELPYPLSRLIDDLEAALERRRFRDRIADAAAGLPDSEYRSILMKTDD